MSQALTHTLTPEAKAALDAGDVEALLAFHRQTFGGHVMELDGGDTDSDQDGDAGQDAGDQDTNDGDQDQDQDKDGDKDPRVQRANRQAAQYRTDLRAAQAELQQVKDAQTQTQTLLDNLRKAITGDTGEGDETDPAEVAQQATARVSELETDNASLRAQLLVHELASDAGANPVALLDSRRFTDQLDALDVSAEDYRDKVAEAIRSAVESNSNLAASQGQPRGGAEGAGRSSDGTVTAEQFARMGYAERAELYQTNPTLYRKLAGN